MEGGTIAIVEQGARDTLEGNYVCELFLSFSNPPSASLCIQNHITGAEPFSSDPAWPQ